MPTVATVVAEHAAAPLISRYGRRPLTGAVAGILVEARERVRDGGVVPRLDEILIEAGVRLQRARAGRLVRIVNATGTILPGSLGRAPLSASARQAALEVAGYAGPGVEPVDARRRADDSHVAMLAAELCGTEAATVTNSPAAALLLVVTALSAGREVLVARSEASDPGSHGRLQDLIPVAGGVLREVGTSDGSSAEAYGEAVGARTGMLLKVHPASYQVVGTARTPSVRQLAAIARSSGIPLVVGVGSGLIHRRHEPPFEDEPSVVDAVHGGADLVGFSGDLLFGGPQAGFLVGRSDLILRCVRHPLAPAIEIDKSRRAALEATVEAHLRADDVPGDLPVWAMLTADLEGLEERASRIAEAIGPVPGGSVSPEKTRSIVGGSAVAGGDLPSWGVRLVVRNPAALAGRLRAGDPGIIGRTEDNAVVLDLRTVPPAQDVQLTELVRVAVAATGS